MLGGSVPRLPSLRRLATALRCSTTHASSLSISATATATATATRHFADAHVALNSEKWGLAHRTTGRTRAAASISVISSRRTHSTHADAAKRGQTGLFSISGLVTTDDFTRMANEAETSCDAMREELAAQVSSQSVPSSLAHAKSMLFQLDQISRTVCNVIDAAELCRSAHSSPEWRGTAQIVFEQLGAYIATLNGDMHLYQALVQVTASSYFAELDEEEQRFAVLLKQEFELEGIHLSDEDRVQAQHNHRMVGEVETSFMQNITNAADTCQLDASLVENLIPRAALVANGAVYSDDGKHVMTDVASPIAHTIAGFAKDSELRRQVHHAMNTAVPANLQVLEDLRQLRHESSVHLGFESYAHRFLQDKMAKSPQKAIAFLDSVQQQISPMYQQEMAVLQQAKQHMEGTASETAAINAWDIKYYVKLMKSQKQFGGLDPASLAPYLNLDNCISTLQFLVDTLFNIQMREEVMADAERWDGHNNSSNGNGNGNGRSQDSIKKFVFMDAESEKMLGTIYLDLHPREGKYTHAAHFTVQCGCLADAETNEFQLPIVALVCNMNSGAASFSTHSEVETLFHEFGHALHSLLSRTKFQHLSGTRGSLDFVETPSHLLEHFVWDERTLSQHLAKNRDGAPIPPDVLASLVQSRNAFRHVEMQNQVVLSMFDQHVFSAPPTKGSDSTSTQTLWKSLHEQANVPLARGTHHYTSVGHLITYGAGYYGYLFAQTFADNIWKHLFEKSPFDRSSGEALWKKMLQHGGSRDPGIILEDILEDKTA